MGELPLHPGLVHLPLGLALVVPLVALFLLVFFARQGVIRRPLGLLLALQVLLVASAFAGLQTGEAEEERVEEVVAHDAIEEHEEAAEVFTWAAVGVLVLSGAAFALARREKLSRGLLAATTVGAIAVAGLGLRTGHEGGELVYHHGAAAAYVGTDAAPRVKVPLGGRQSDDDRERPRARERDDD